MAFIKTLPSQIAQLKVIGVGGGGGNTINSIIENGDIKGVDLIAINTDSQALLSSKAKIKIQIGDQVTKGLGSGGDPELAAASVEESKDRIKELLEGTDMVFITCGLGGGTGTGASPLIAQIAKKELGILTVAVVTKPFFFEGTRRMVIADQGMAKLKENVDTLISIPNQKIMETVTKESTLRDAFKVVDSVINRGVQAISDLITTPGLINLDFADIRSVMQDSGTALMGVGEAEGEGRASKALESAISSPLVDTPIEGATGILLNITGGPDLTMREVEEAANTVTKKVETDANVIFGTVIDPDMEGRIKITVIATGFDNMKKDLSRMIKKADRAVPLSESPEPPSLDSEKTQKKFEVKIPKLDRKTSRLLKNKVIPEGLRIENELDIPSFLRKSR